MQKEALKYMKKCDLCQRFAPNTHQGFLNPLSSPSPFTQWGLDIVDPFPKAEGNRSICWLAQIISPNGLKLSLWRIPEMWTQRSFSRKTLSLTSGYPTPSSRTMDFSSTANPLGDTVVSWELQIDTPFRHTLRERTS